MCVLWHIFCCKHSASWSMEKLGVLTALMVSGKEQVSAAGWVWGPAEILHPPLVIPTSVRVLNASVEQKWYRYTRAVICSWLFYPPPQVEENLLAPLTAGQIDICRNQVEPGCKSVENFFYNLPYDDEKWNREPQFFAHSKCLCLFFPPENLVRCCLHWPPVPCCQYAHTCRQWASGILVSALKQGSKCKLKTGVKRIVERIIFLELVM